MPILPPLTPGYLEMPSMGSKEPMLGISKEPGADGAGTEGGIIGTSLGATGAPSPTPAGALHLAPLFVLHPAEHLRGKVHHQVTMRVKTM